MSLDLLDVGIDVWDRHLMATRPGVWLRAAIVGLLTRPPTIFREEPIPGDDKHVRLQPVWPTRAQRRWPDEAKRHLA